MCRQSCRSFYFSWRSCRRFLAGSKYRNLGVCCLFFFFFLPFSFRYPLQHKMASGFARERSRLDSSFVWLALYFVLNLALTLYNKIILSVFQFPFPWTLTAIHTLCGAIGSYIFWKTGVFTPAQLGDRENLTMLLFSILYTINIAISNVSL